MGRCGQPDCVVRIADVHGSVIEQHRLAQQELPLALPSGMPDDQDNEVHLGAESVIRRVV